MNDEKSVNEEKSTLKNFVIGALTGGAIATVVSLLYAPKSGKRMRRDITTYTDGLMHDAKRYINTAKDYASDLLYEGKDKVVNLIHTNSVDEEHNNNKHKRRKEYSEQKK